MGKSNVEIIRHLRSTQFDLTSFYEILILVQSTTVPVVSSWSPFRDGLYWGLSYYLQVGLKRTSGSLFRIELPHMVVPTHRQLIQRRNIGG